MILDLGGQLLNLVKVFFMLFVLKKAFLQFCLLLLQLSHLLLFHLSLLSDHGHVSSLPVPDSLNIWLVYRLVTYYAFILCRWALHILVYEFSRWEDELNQLLLRLIVFRSNILQSLSMILNVRWVTHLTLRYGNLFLRELYLDLQLIHGGQSTTKIRFQLSYLIRQGLLSSLEGHNIHTDTLHCRLNFLLKTLDLNLLLLMFFL